jgi:peptidoglycan LD-endopeptidase LytH
VQVLLDRAAHLDHYADGLKEGLLVRRGGVLGYHGTSGNASREAPHLHFANFRLNGKKQWWRGTPIDPYEVFR